MQLMTTKEPDDDMIRVGIASVEAVFDWKKYLSDEFGAAEQAAESCSDNAECNNTAAAMNR
jgi:uncharacterized protein YqhQ